MRRSLGAIALVAAVLAGLSAGDARPQDLNAGSVQASLSYRTTGWNWGSPRPTGEAVFRAEAAAGTVYVSAGPDVLRSDDAGATWSKLPAPERRQSLDYEVQPIRVLEPVGATTLFVGDECGLARSLDRGQTFEELVLPPALRGCRLQTAAFPTEDAWYLMARDGALSRTLDGGRSFEARGTLPGAAATGVEVVFTSPEEGVALAGAAGENADAIAGPIEPADLIYRTTDGGRTWRVVAEPQQPLRGLEFVSAQVGFAIGDGGVLLRTTDGGESWERLRLDAAPTHDLLTIDCADRRRCAIVGERRFRRALVLFDPGTGASSVSATGGDLLDVAFISQTRLLGVGDSGLMRTSDDGGRSFTERSQGSASSCSTGALERTPAGLLAGVYGEGPLLRSLDGGQRWSRFGPADGDGEVTSVAFRDRRSGFALRVGGYDNRVRDLRVAILRTGNGGRTWRRVARSVFDRVGAVAAGRRALLTAGAEGLRSSRGGAGLRRVRGPAGRARLEGFDRGRGVLVAFGRRFAARSVDGGRRWRRVPLPGRSRVREVDFVDRSVGYLAASGNAYRTRDGGRTWQLLRAVGDDFVRSVAFADRRSGWLNVSVPSSEDRYDFYPGDARLLRTTNGGRTFRRQSLDHADAVSEVTAVGRNRAVACVDGGLIWTGSGGDRGRATTITARATSTRRSNGVVDVSVTGRLRPALSGSEVTVLFQRRGAWASRRATTDGAGRFSATGQVRREPYVVVRFEGDATRRAAGSRVVRVPVGRRKGR